MSSLLGISHLSSLLKSPYPPKYLPNQSDSCLKFSQAFCASWLNTHILLNVCSTFAQPPTNAPSTDVCAYVALFIFTVSCQLFLLAGIILCTHLYANCQAHASGRSRKWAKTGAYGIYKLRHQSYGSASVRASVSVWCPECESVCGYVCFVGASKLACHCRLICLLGFCLSFAAAVGTQILRRVN